MSEQKKRKEIKQKDACFCYKKLHMLVTRVLLLTVRQSDQVSPAAVARWR